MQRCALVVGGVLAAVAITGCAGGGIAAPVDSPVAIEISPFFLTVRNVGSQPLTDLTIGIKPGGVRPEYQMSLRRLGLRQDVGHSLRRLSRCRQGLLEPAGRQTAVGPYHRDGPRRHGVRHRAALAVKSGPVPLPEFAKENPR